MLESEIKASINSRPIYGKLRPVAGREHLLVADLLGAQALLELCAAADSDFLAKCHIIYINQDSQSEYQRLLAALNPGQWYFAPTYQAALSRLRRALNAARMGLQVYLSGSEGLIGQAMYEATSVGIDHRAIQTEHRGSTARRMQCVHCKGITEDVTHDPFECSHCGLHLYVRDHYSRRIAAFQGVRVDAEDPGNIPTPVELFR